MNKNAGCTLAAIGAAVVLLLIVLIGYPQYRVYSLRLAGEAALAEAQSSRQVAILEARAKKESAIALAERINALAPNDGPAKTAFFTTGVEAVENAVKIARYATGRSAVIAFQGAFHGRTLMGLTLTGKVNPYKAGFGTMMSDVYHVPFPTNGVSVDDSLNAITTLFKTDVDPRRVAAIIVEPVQGEGGFNPVPTALFGVSSFSVQ